MLGPAQIPDLSRRAEDLLVGMVDLAANLPPVQQQFLYANPLGTGGAFMRCGNHSINTVPQDVKELRHAALIDGVVPSGSKSALFTLTHRGRRVAEAITQRGEPLEAIEDESVRYMDAPAFKARYPEAAQKWAHAAGLLTATDAANHATRIGHDCREALAAFAAALVARHDAGRFDKGRGTVDSIRASIATRRDELGESVAALLHALVVYWGAVSDLAQRQEHAAQKEGEYLTEQDSRRIVWYSALVMYELDRTLG